MEHTKGYGAGDDLEKCKKTFQSYGAQDIGFEKARIREKAVLALHIPTDTELCLFIFKAQTHLKVNQRIVNPLNDGGLFPRDAHDKWPLLTALPSYHNFFQYHPINGPLPWPKPSAGLHQLVSYPTLNGGSAKAISKEKSLFFNTTMTANLILTTQFVIYSILLQLNQLVIRVCK